MPVPTLRGALPWRDNTVASMQPFPALHSALIAFSRSLSMRFLSSYEIGFFSAGFAASNTIKPIFFCSLS